MSVVGFRAFKWQLGVYALLTGLLFANLLVLKPFPLSQNSYTHLRIARLYLQGVFDLSSLGVLPHSGFGEAFINQHALYHLLLLPFVALFDDPIAAKLANATLVASFLAGLAFLLRELRVKNPFLWATIVPFLGESFYPRLFWERPEPLIGAFLFFTTALLLRKRPARTYLVSGLLFGCLSYFAWLGPALAALRSGLRAVRRQGLDPVPLLALSVGIAGSLLLSWHPLRNFSYAIALIRDTAGHSVRIAEWLPAPEPLTRGAPAALLLFAGLLGLARKKARAREPQIFIAGCATLFFLLTLRSQRFEYLTGAFSGALFVSVFLRQPAFTWFSRRNLASGLILLLALGGLARAAQGIRAIAAPEFQGAQGDLYPLAPFLQWHARNGLAEQPFINFRWEYWSQEFHAAPRTRAEPGFSMSLYRTHAPDLFELFETLRYVPEAWSGDRAAEFWTRLVRATPARHLLVDKKSAAIERFDRHRELFTPVYEDVGVKFFRIHDPREDTRRLAIQDEIRERLQRKITALLDARIAGAGEAELLRLGRRLDEAARSLAEPARSAIEQAELFVTVHERSTLAMRGCWSHDAGRSSLSEKLASAFENALKDPRHARPRALRADEVGHYQVSILHDRRKVASHWDFPVGRRAGLYAYGLRGEGGRQATFLAEVPLGRSWSSERIVQQLRSKAGVREDSPYELSLSDQYAFSAGGSLHKGVPLEPAFPQAPVDRARLRAAIGDATEFLLSLQRPDGGFAYQYDPYSDRPGDALSGLESSETVRLRLTWTANVLCRATDFVETPGLRARARQGCAGALRHLERRFGALKPETLGVQSQLALLEQQLRPGSPRLLALRGELLAFRRASDGSFDTRRGGGRRGDEELFYPGEALLFLARRASGTQDPEATEILHRALPYYRGLFERTGSPFLARWHAEAYSLMGSAPEGSAYRDALEAMWKELSRQLSPPSPLWPEAQGCFLGGAEHPNYVSALLLEGFAPARKTGSVPREELDRLAACVLRQQLTPEAMGEFRNPVRALGAFPTGLDDRRVRVDLHAHALNALMSYSASLD
ncbi:MAG: AMMECR1 family protein [Oligoflexia bacterium]|nr:AMMECR1 family protein [Oligoflexia bacterium]